MKQTHRFATFLVIAFMAITAVHAQTDLTGRTYYNPNILKEEIEQKMKELETTITQKRAELIAKAEEEKGRKLTAEEIAAMDEHLEQASKLTVAMSKGMKTAVTMEFKTDVKCVMKMDVDLKDDVLKAAGVSWAKRKLMKAAMAIAPSTHKAKYVVHGNLVILDDGEDKDTLTLSADGKYLSGKADGKAFVLTRTK